MKKREVCRQVEERLQVAWPFESDRFVRPDLAELEGVRHRHLYGVNPVEHFVPVCQKPFEETLGLVADARRFRANLSSGFISFQSLGTILMKLGLWDKLRAIAPELPEEFGVPSNHKKRAAFLALLNGSSLVDYRTLFPNTEELLDLMIEHKYGGEAKLLSIMDVILAELMRQSFSPDTGSAIINRACVAACRSLSQAAEPMTRTQLYRSLREIADGYPTPHLYQHMIDAASAQMVDSLPRYDSHRGTNLVLVLYSGVLEPMCMAAAKIVRDHPEVFVIPSGGTQPLHAKSLEVSIPCSEADYMLAILLAEPFTPGLMGMPDLGYHLVNTQLQCDDVIAPDSDPNDSVSNVEGLRQRVQAYAEVTGKSEVRVTVVTAAFHCRRMLYHLDQTFRERPVDRVLVKFDCVPIMSHREWNMSRYRFPTGLGALVAEQLKLLYALCTD